MLIHWSVILLDNCWVIYFLFFIFLKCYPVIYQLNPKNLFIILTAIFSKYQSKIQIYFNKNI